MNVQGSSTAEVRGPVRTCVGCRQRAHQRDLLRVVLVEGGLTPDWGRELSGRGAYVHPTRECVDAALARKAFGRALRVGGSLEESGAALRAHIDSRSWERRDDNPMNSQR